MKAWETLMTLADPDVWDSHPEPGHKGYQDFQRAVERYKAFDRKGQLAMGRTYLRGFKRIEIGMSPEYCAPLRG
jgi:hypothetical protein